MNTTTGQADSSTPATARRGGAVCGVLMAIALLLGTACDDIDTMVAELEEEFGGREASRGRVGTRVALGVSQRAHRRAEAMAAAPHENCALERPASSFVQVTEIEIERESRGASPVSWVERRTFRHDGDGHISLTMEADYRQQLGLEGTQRRETRLVGETLYVSLDGERFFAREADSSSRRRLTRRGLGSLQVLLDANRSGWSRDPGATVWSTGGQPLICGPRDPEAPGWLRQLETRGEVVRGRLEIEPRENSRMARLRWLLEDGVAMTAEVREQVRAEPVNVTAPEPGRIVQVERDRDWRRMNGLLEQLVEASAAERASQEKQIDEKREDPTDGPE